MKNGHQYPEKSGVPAVTDPEYVAVAARLHRLASDQAGRRPWRRTFRIVLEENSDLHLHGKPRLTMWFVSSNAVDALWASVALFSLHRVIRVICPQVNRIVYTCPADGVTGYSPRIVRKFNSRVSHPAEFLNPHLHEFEKWLCKLAVSHGDEDDGPDSNSQLLWSLGRNPRVQWGAIVQLMRHAADQGYLACDVGEALRVLELSKLLTPPVPDGRHVLTRWKAMRMLAQKDLLNGFVGVQRPLRPHGTSAAPMEILNLVSTIFQMPADELTGPRRNNYIIHPRYFAATVIRRTTSRSLESIGALLGGRDHATVINGIEQIDEWTESDPVHGKLLDMIVQNIDNLGILKRKEFRLQALAEARHLQPPVGDAQPGANGAPDRHHGDRTINGARVRPGSSGKVVSLKKARTHRPDPEDTV